MWNILKNLFKGAAIGLALVVGVYLLLRWVFLK
jgi:hypothetical protein